MLKRQLYATDISMYFSGSIIKWYITFEKQHTLGVKNTQIYYAQLEKNKENGFNKT